MKISDDVLTVLSNSAIDGNSLVLASQIDRKLYLKTNDVLVAAGGKWNKKAKVHLFSSDATEIIDQIILTGEITIPQDFGYFPTPTPVVQQLIELADIQPDMSVLEPEAGQGAIAKELSKIATVDCVELLPQNADVLQKDNHYRNITIGDFLEISPNPIYDRIVMNPPFNKQDDIKHVTHALKFLKPDGLLVSVMSASVSFRENNLTKEFRQLISSRNGQIIPLPKNSFKLSGTGVNTVIVSIPANLSD